jgi:transcriptional regulator with XRE-family HTH domain
MSILKRLTRAGGPEGGNEEGNGVAHGNGLHRLAEVRRLQEVSRRTIGRRLNIEVAEVRQQEDPATDLPLSKLYAWQKALGVPVSELLIESDEGLSEPLLRRAQLVRLMKTALSIRDEAEAGDVSVLANTLVDQLIELMPELRGVSAWHLVGRRRGLSELGVAAERSVSGGVFVDLD